MGRKQLSPNNKCHVIFIVFFKFYIKSAGGDDKFVVINKFRAFWCMICLWSWIRSYLPPKKSDRKPWLYCDVICRLSSLFNTLVLTSSHPQISASHLLGLQVPANGPGIEYETVPYFLQSSQNLTSDCLLISVFLPVFTSLCIMWSYHAKTGKNTEINKQSDVLA
jgi:hypothetical protein